MQEKKVNISVIISIVFSVLCLCALGFIAYWLPEVVDSMIDTVDHLGDRSQMTAIERRLVLTDAYAMLAIAFVAVLFIFLLLRVVYRGEVFSKSATRTLTVLVLCCFAEGILFVLLSPYFQIALCIAVAAFLLGLLLRVVTHVINEAMRIKSENDFTI